MDAIKILKSWETSSWKPSARSIKIAQNLAHIMEPVKMYKAKHNSIVFMWPKRGLLQIKEDGSLSFSMWDSGLRIWRIL